MGYEMRTLNGYNFYDMTSMLQKAIRRGDLYHAGFALKELLPKYAKYVWKRLIGISAEDCYGIVTKEIMALEQADEWFKKNNKGQQEGLFAAKACVLLCLARKNRDACYVACNFMDANKLLAPEEIEDYIKPDDPNERIRIPDYVFDCHTRTGKIRGKNIVNMIEEENDALFPHQISLFDNADWGPFLKNEQEHGNLQSPKEQKQIMEFQLGKETDPTHGGEDWPEMEETWGETPET